MDMFFNKFIVSECNAKWWTVPLFLGNLWTVDNTCLPHLWYACPSTKNFLKKKIILKMIKLADVLYFRFSEIYPLYPRYIAADMQLLCICLFPAILLVMRPKRGVALLAFMTLAAILYSAYIIYFYNTSPFLLLPRQMIQVSAHPHLIHNAQYFLFSFIIFKLLRLKLTTSIIPGRQLRTVLSCSISATSRPDLRRCHWRILDRTSPPHEIT